MKELRLRYLRDGIVHVDGAIGGLIFGGLCNALLPSSREHVAPRALVARTF